MLCLCAPLICTWCTHLLEPVVYWFLGKHLAVHQQHQDFNHWHFCTTLNTDLLAVLRCCISDTTAASAAVMSTTAPADSSRLTCSCSSCSADECDVSQALAATSHCATMRLTAPVPPVINIRPDSELPDDEASQWLRQLRS